MKTELATWENPELTDYYSEQYIRKFASQMIDALDYLHSELNIVHRDIKPSNVMIDGSGNPVLVDFGKAKQLYTREEDTTSSMEGTYTFLPPESCSFETMTYSMKKADIWALGITIYIMVFNEFPFDIRRTEIDLMENICNFQLNFPNRKVSSELRQMLSMFLEKDPEKRATLEELKNCAFIKSERLDSMSCELSSKSGSEDSRDDTLRISSELSMDLND